MRVVILVALLILAAGALGILGDSFVVANEYQRVIPSCLFVTALLISILLPHKKRFIVFTNDGILIPSLFVKSKQTLIRFEAIADIQEKMDANSEIMHAKKSIYITMENKRRRIRIIQLFFERDGYESFASCLRQRINADSSLKCTTTFYKRDDA
jgi:hypothetical protein